MTSSQKIPSPDHSPVRRARRWRTFGVIVLLLGGFSAGAAYWHARQSAALMDDSSMSRFHRAERRQMGMFYGKAGYLMDDLMNELKQPVAQALAIGLASVVVAAGCFFIAGMPPLHHDPDFFKPSSPNKTEGRNTLDANQTER
jgi:hypothetical protein